MSNKHLIWHRYDITNPIQIANSMRILNSSIQKAKNILNCILQVFAVKNTENVHWAGNLEVAHL